jgi:hypothetical protein
MREIVYRFIVGGLIVSLFAAIGDILKPKSFAGLFGAAPSVAIATLSLTILESSKNYAALEARSMIFGAIAFFVYSCLCVHLMMKHNMNAISATVFGLAVWLVSALSSWLFFLR